MNINKAKDLIDEYRNHERIVRTIEKAISNNNWIAVCTPNNSRGECISDMQIKLILDESKRRIEEIEKLLDGIKVD